MEVFQNGLTGLLVVRRVGVDSNYVIETVPVPFQRMEEKVVRAGILQMCEHVWWALATCQVIFFHHNSSWEKFQLLISISEKKKMLLFDCDLNHSFIFVRVCGFVSTVDGGFSEWSNWTTCSVVCGTGFQLRHRNCTSPSPAYGGKSCESKNFTEGRTCAMGPCQLPGNCAVVLLIVIIVVIFAQHECLRRRFTFLSRHWKKRKS